MFESLMAINGLLVAVFFAVGILMLILRIWNVGKTEYVKRPFISGIVFIFPIIPMYNQRYGISLVLLIAAVLVNINLYFSSDTSGIWLLLGKSVLACAIILVPFLFIYWKIFIVGFYLIIPAVLTVMAIFIEQSREVISKILIVFGMFFIPIFLAITNFIYIGLYLCPISILPVILFTLAIFEIMDFKYPIRLTVTLLILSIPLWFFRAPLVTGVVADLITQINEFVRVNMYDKVVNILDHL